MATTDGPLARWVLTRLNQWKHARLTGEPVGRAPAVPAGGEAERPTPGVTIRRHPVRPAPEGRRAGWCSSGRHVFGHRMIRCRCGLSTGEILRGRRDR